MTWPLIKPRTSIHLRRSVNHRRHRVDRTSQCMFSTVKKERFAPQGGKTDDAIAGTNMAQATLLQDGRFFFRSVMGVDPSNINDSHTLTNTFVPERYMRIENDPLVWLWLSATRGAFMTRYRNKHHPCVDAAALAAYLLWERRKRCLQLGPTTAQNRTIQFLSWRQRAGKTRRAHQSIAISERESEETPLGLRHPG